MPEPIITADNNELKKRLAERIEAKQTAPVIRFSWWKIAAALIVLVGAGWLYTGIKNKPAVENIVKADVIKKEPSSVTKTDTAPAIPDSVTNPIALRDVAVNKSSKRVLKRDTRTSKDKEPAAASPVSSAAEPPLVSTQAETEKSDEAATYKNETLARQTPKKKEAEKAVSADRPGQKAQGIAAEEDKGSNTIAGRAGNASNTFNGNITDQQNKPLANAFIQIPNLNVATQTDKRGYFSFHAADTVLNVSVASDGFETQNIHLRNKATLNQIVLSQVPASQREVVVQSNGAARKKESLTNDISIKILDAEPVTGWTAYHQYLEKNKKINDDAKNIHGTVVVSFDVRKTWINNFVIEQSLDEELDAEAIRLIKEGPAWKLLKGKKTSVTVAVKF